MLPGYSRQTLQQFMREPLPAAAKSLERPCANGDGCICMTQNISYPLLSASATANGAGAGGGGGGGRKERAFICREFRVVVNRQILENEPAAPCLLCNRFATTAQVMRNARARPDHSSPTPMTLLQDHYVLIGAGEYNADVCLPISMDNSEFNGVVRPQVMYSAAHYAPSVTQVAGYTLRCVVELKTLDFRQPWAAAIAT
jgi:hypothetical protein